MALCATTALADAVSRLCVRGARGRFGGVRAGAWCGVSPSSPFPPRVFRAACGGPSRPGVPYPGSLVRHSMRSVRSARSVFGSRLVGSPAWHGLPQCPGYGHWISYCCVLLVFGSGLWLGSGFGCAPPLLAGVLGCVCACVCAPFVPSHSWLGCVVWVCVVGFGFRLRPATPGWGVGFVSACVRAPLGPRHSWLGCAAGVCVLWLGFPLRPADPGWGVWVCVCSCARSACTQPLLARVRGMGVCVWARDSAAPRHSWLGCWAVCVLLCALRLHPAIPGTGERCGCVCLGSGFGCAPPLLARVLGCLCAVFGALLAPRHSCLGFVVFGLAVAWHLFVCRGSLRVVRALRVCGTWRPSLPGTCPCALVVVGGVPLWCASWPRVVRRASSGPVALGALVGFPVAVVPFPSPGACAPGFTGRLRGAHGGRPRTGLFVPAVGPRRGGGAGLAPRRTRSGPRDGVVPGGSLRRWSWAACAAVVGVCGPGY